MKQPTLVLLVPLNSLGSQTWVQTPKSLLHLYYKPRYSHIYNDAMAILKNGRHG